MKRVYVKITKNEKITKVGSWNFPNEEIHNFMDQQDLGWHVFQAILNKADKIEIIVKEV